MISFTPLKDYHFAPEEYVLGSYSFPEMICVVQKSDILWLDRNLQLMHKYTNFNRVVIPIGQLLTIQVSDCNEIVVRKEGKVKQTLDASPNRHNTSIHALGNNTFLLATTDQAPSNLLSVDPQTYEYESLMKYDIGHKRLTYSAKIMNQLLVTCSSDRTVKIVNVPEKVRVRQLKLPMYGYDLHFVNENELLVCGEFPYVFLYDLRTSKYQVKIPTSHEQTSSFGALDNSHLILGHNNSISTLDLNSFSINSSEVGSDQKIWNINKIDKGRVLVSGGHLVKVFGIKQQ